MRRNQKLTGRIPVLLGLVAGLLALVAMACRAQPVIMTQPASQTMVVGGDVTFSVTANGIPPLAYQWWYNGNPLLNATNPALTLSGVQFSNSGSYSMVVSNAQGARTSLSALLTVSQVAAWGAGLSNASSPNFGQSLVPAGLSNAVALAGGGYHSLALLPSGGVRAWGSPAYGLTYVPSGLNNATALAAGLSHSLALRSNGTVSAWGYSVYSQTSVPAAATNVAAIAAGWYHSLALRSNGTVVAWGAGTGQGVSPHFGQSLVPTNLANVTAIAAGGYHSLALKRDGTVVAWGWNAAGQTNVPVGLTNVVAIAAGGSNSLALKSDGTLVAWGDNTYGQTNVPAGLTNVVVLSAGAAHNLALKSDGTLVAWGLNTYGQTNLPAALTNVAALSAGGFHNLALVNIGPVTFLNSPYSQTLYKGDNASFTPAMLGAAPLSYQWLQNGTAVGSATNASLAITNAQLSDAGNYQLVVSNSFGAVTSAVAVLTVNDTAPFFTLQPASQRVLQNRNASFAATAGGVPPLSYQWQCNGTNIAGATDSAFALTNAQLTDEANYCLVVTNAYGLATSSNAFLNVVDLSEALGPTNLTWVNSSQPAWFAQSDNTYNHDFAAVAVGPLAYDVQSRLQTSVSGPGTLTFLFTGLGVTLTFSIDGRSYGNWQSYYSSVWNRLTFYLGAGNHILTWTETGNSFSGSGTAYLDQVVFTPGPTPATIATQPTSQTIGAGSNVTLNVNTLGTPPMRYQWYFNGLSLPGALGSSLTLNNVQADKAGTYSVVVSNDWGMAVSADAVLGVTPSVPVLTLQPVSVPVMVGMPATFSGAAIGTTPLAYQWLFNGAPIPGATTSSLTLSSVQSANGGNYALAISNTVGVTVSSNAFLQAYTVADLAAALDNPAISWSTTNVPWFPQTNVTYDGISAAQSGAISDGQQSTLQGIVNGPATVTYWWKVSCDDFWDSLAFSLNGTVQNSIAGSVDWQPATNYLGAGSQTLQWSLYPVHGAFAGGTGWVDQVQVIPGGTGVFITTQPVGRTSAAGNNVGFSVSATGTPPLLYQWQLNGLNLPGATNAALTVNNVQDTDAGTYAVTVSNGFGTAVSSNVTLVVNASVPVITTQPLSQSGVLNNNATFTVTAKGSNPLSYQWQFNGVPLPGATTTTLSLTGLQPANAGSYSVVVSNLYGTVTSSTAALEVNSTAVVEFWPMLTSGYGTPFGLGNVIGVAAGSSHSVALRADGTVTAWGQNTYGQTNVPAGLSQVTAIAAGYNHTAALRADGTVVVWGDNAYGQQLVPAGLSNATVIAATANHTLALKSDGTVVGWGNDASGQLNVPPGLSNVVSISAGVYNGFAVKADGTVVQWGNGPVWQRNGANIQLAVGVGLSNVVAVAGAGYTGWSLQNDATVQGWGWAAKGALGVTALVASGLDGSPLDDYALALSNDGTVAVLGGTYIYTPFIPRSPPHVVACAAGNGHAVVLLNDGTPRVAQRLLDQTVYSGATVAFNSGMVGAGPLAYQWQFNGTNLDGATNGQLLLTNVPLSASGHYACLVTNSLGAATNLNATLTVLRSTPRFNSAPARSAEGFGWQLNQLSGHGPIVIWFSTNLVDWVPLLTNPPVTGSLQFLDPAATHRPRGFYRAVEQ